VQYWADLQLVHGFRCYDNSAEREITASACIRSMAGLFQWAVGLQQQRRRRLFEKKADVTAYMCPVSYRQFRVDTCLNRKSGGGKERASARYLAAAV